VANRTQMKVRTTYISKSSDIPKQRTSDRESMPRMGGREPGACMGHASVTHEALLKRGEKTAVQSAPRVHLK